jgi:hypothetical protein
MPQTAAIRIGALGKSSLGERFAPSTLNAIFTIEE